MGKYNENILDESLWIAVTPTPVALKMPFYVTEIGHFFAEKDYYIKRDYHDSFLLIYTVSGSGTLKTDASEISLLPDTVAIIDCKNPHEYGSNNGSWEFLWIHLNGSSAKNLFDTLYPDGVKAVSTGKAMDIKYKIFEIMKYGQRNDVASSIRISSITHSVFDSVFSCAINSETADKGQKHLEDIKTVVSFIEKNYTDSITVDDMIMNIHISKYHFIRIFRRVMGVTPYNYLTNYRINSSKELLHSTDIPISEISRMCGFDDTSNFISHFKKHTFQTPLQYRYDFRI